MSKKAQANNASDELSALLGEIGGKKKKGKLSKAKKIIIAVVAFVVVAAIAVGIIFGVRSKQTASGAPVYREYKVTRGDIIVGLTESSVITLNKENITFSVGAEVLELYVKSGSQVKKGDPLAKLSIDDISEAIADYEKEIDSAYADLQSAKISRDSELLKAAQTLETNLLNGELSDSDYAVSVAQAELDLESAQKALETAQEKYNDLAEKSETFSSDLKKLNNYEDKVESLQESVDKYSEKKNEYNSISSELSQVQNEIRSIADASNMEQAEAMLEELKENYEKLYESYYSSAETTMEQQATKYSDLLKAQEKYENLEASMDELEDLFEEQEELKDKLDNYDIDDISEDLADAEEDLADAREAYEEFKEEYTEKYGNITKQDDMDSSVAEALTSLEKAKLSLEKQQSNYKSTLLSAEQKKESTDSAASTAQKEYNLKKTEVNQKVTTAQEQYDTLVEELAEIKETVGNDGVITSPCDGIVSSLSIAVGDEISAGSAGDSMGFSSSSVATLMTITDMSEANVSVSISEDDILDIYLEQEAVVSLAAFPDESFDAVVDSISVEGATIGAASVSYTVNVKFTNDAGLELLDGMSADVTLVQGSAMDALYVSKQAVTTKDSVSTVLVKGEDGNGVETQVTIGFTDGQYVEILSGLNEGDTILVQSALGATDAEGSGGNSSLEMPDMGNFDMSNMPDMGNFNPGEMMK